MTETQDSTAGPTAAFAPVRPSERLFSLDVVRGFAVLGILAVNAMTFAFPYTVAMNPTLQPGGLEGDGVLAWQVMSAFFQDKMRTLFSMLFGVSIFLIGGERSDRARGRLLRRRLFWLALFGLLHGLAFWYGDILLLYAWTGLFVLLARSWSARRLLIVGVLLNLLCSALYVGLFASLQFAPAEAIQSAMEGSGWTSTAAEVQAAIDRFGAADPLAVTLAAAETWVSVVPIMLILFLPATAALMLIGMGLFKSGWLSGRAPVWVYGLFLVLGAGALWLIWREAAATAAGGFEFLDVMTRAANSFLAPLVSLGYAAALILLARLGLRRLLWPLAAAGRMAFTNYLTQTLIMTTLFYGGRGLGLYGTIGWPEMWGVIAAVWALQLVWSPLWLSRFQMGPMEWVWRRLTYGRAVPIRRAAGT